MRSARWMSAAMWAVSVGLMVAGWASAAPVSPEAAKELANNWAYLHGSEIAEAGWTASDASSEPSVTSMSELRSGEDVVAYAFTLPTGGEIVVPNEDELPPVFFWSATGTFDPSANPTAEYLFGAYLSALQCAQSDEAVSADAGWAAVTSQAAAYRSQKTSANAVPQATTGPLVTTQWSQGDPYWRLCPTYQGSNCYVGCTATAIAQIMRYWQYPDVATGSVSYTTSTLGISVVIADMSVTPFDWDNMPAQVSPVSTQAQIDAVARLSFYAGATANMDYTPDSSGAWGSAACDALIDHFKYSSDATFAWAWDYDAATWATLIADEISSSRPIWYTGYDLGGSGHAFVLDGTQDTSGTMMYHFNLGWAGQCDGWYNLTMTSGGSCAGSLYSEDQGAIFGIHPPTNALTVTTTGRGRVTPKSGTYGIGQRVALTAIPADGWQVKSWSGTDDDTSTKTTNTVTMNATKTVTVVFESIMCNLTMTVVGYGDATPSTGSYARGTVVTLTATPEVGCEVKSWKGTDDDASTATTNTVTLDEDAVVTVTMASDLAVEPEASQNPLPYGSTCTIAANASGGVTPYVYSWNIGGTGSSVSLRPWETTTYTVVVTDAIGQKVTKTIELQVVDVLTGSLSASKMAIVTGGEVTLTASAEGGVEPYTYTWSDGQDGASVKVSPLTSTQYTVTITDAIGQTVEKDVVITVGSSLVAMVTPEQKTIDAGEEVALTTSFAGGVGPWTIAWSNGSTDSATSVKPTTTTTYSVTISDSLGQRTTKTAVVTVRAAAPTDPTTQPTTDPTEIIPGVSCFVATAAYGSTMANDVCVLRTFRDECLMTNVAGQKFVAAYYRLSPAVANVIARDASLRSASRAMLMPIVWTVKHPAAAAIVVMMIVVLMTVGVRRSSRVAEKLRS